MKLVFYLDSFFNYYYDNIPIIIQGKSQEGFDCWFYISKTPMIDENIMIPHIFIKGVEVFIKKRRYSESHTILFDDILSTDITGDKKDYFFPGDPVSIEELAKIFEINKIPSFISNFSGIFYTINISLRGEIFAGNTSFIPYNNLVNNNQFINLGKSEKYTSYNVFIFSDSSIIKREWPQLIANYPEFKKFNNSLEKIGIKVNLKK